MINDIFDDGDILSSDMDIVESITGYDNVTASMYVESIAKRWSLPTLYRESTTIDGMWSTFLDWIETMYETISSFIKNMAGHGRSALRKQRKLQDTFTRFKDSCNGTSSKSVDKSTYAKFFIVSDKYDPGQCSMITKSLPKDVESTLTWSIGAIKEAANIMELYQSDGTAFDSVKETNVNKVAVKTITNFEHFIGNRLSRSFTSHSGRTDGEEKQLLWALPGNAYMQYYTFNFMSSSHDDEFPIEGIRFITGDITTVNPSELNGVESALPFDKIYGLINEIEPLAKTLLNIEKHDAALKRQIRDFRAIAKKRKTTGAKLSVAERYSYRLARERVLGSNASFRSAVYTLRMSIDGLFLRIHHHQLNHLNK